MSVVTVTLVTLGLAAVCGGTWWPFSAGEEEETVAAGKGRYTWLASRTTGDTDQRDCTISDYEPPMRS